MLADRFWSKVDTTAGILGCWLWTAYVGPHGYGQLSVGRERFLAHRYVYERVVGPIPEGMHLDHVCRTRHCVNPGHLEVVTNAENTRRGKALITSCPAGHPYDEANTSITRLGHRRCLACARAWNRARRERVAAERPPRVPSTVCRNGHPRTGASTFVRRDGSRECRPCHAAAERMRRQRSAA